MHICIKTNIFKYIYVYMYIYIYIYILFHIKPDSGHQIPDPGSSVWKRDSEVTRSAAAAAPRQLQRPAPSKRLV